MPELIAYHSGSGSMFITRSIDQAVLHRYVLSPCCAWLMLLHPRNSVGESIHRMFCDLMAHKELPARWHQA